MSRRRPKLHPAVRGFDRRAPTYERGRPGYPAAAVRYLAQRLGLRPGRVVVDLGSGTGKFTRALAPTGAAIVAVEPMAGMRRVFVRKLPGMLVLPGQAEAIPLPDGFADAVVVAQAFHWFRTGAALREIARVLRPGGGVALVWNVRDESVPWVRRLTELLDRYGEAMPRARQRRWRRPFDRSGRFAPLRLHTFRHVQRASPATVVERVWSVSVIAVLPPARQRAVAREVRASLAADPATRGRAVVGLPYRTEVYTSRLRPRRRPAARRSRRVAPR
jgi:SAM-dependent methyltransferase